MDASPAQTAAMDSKSLHSQLRYKWLHQGRFTWPPIRDGVVHLTATQLAMLLDYAC
jgi:transposase